MSTWQDLKNNPRLRRIFEDRILIMKFIRDFFWQEDFVEMETPIAVRLPGQEPYLNPVGITLTRPSGDKHELKLRTSPEFALKKILAAGYEKIFELGKSFRDNEDFSGIHHPEFTMLEWYRRPGTMDDIMTDTENLFRYVLQRLEKKNIYVDNKEILIEDKWERMSMRDLFKIYVGVNLDDYLEIKLLRALAEVKGYKWAPTDEYEDIFYKLFLNEIEPNVGWERPVFIYDYPARMCSMSRLSEDDQRYGERFELYIGGLEVANAFGELTDPGQQRANLQKDRNLREKLGKPTWPIDEDFLLALGELDSPEKPPAYEEIGIRKEAYGTPTKKPSKTAAGIALGVDRMVVLCTGAKDIKEVIFENIEDQLTF